MRKFILLILSVLFSMEFAHATVELTIDKDNRYNMRCTYSETTGAYTLTGTGKYAYVPIDSLTRDLTAKEVKLCFEYSTMGGINDFTLTFGNDYGQYYSDHQKISYGKLEATGSDYVSVSYDLTSDICAFMWGHKDQTFRIGINDDERIKIKNLRIEEVEPNVQGTITCNSIGVANVVVSDGYNFTRTDANGEYAFYSNKKNGYVFYEIPSGYMPLIKSNTTTDEKIFARFWKDLTYENDLSRVETVNFQLEVENNMNFRMLVSADPQMSNRINDVKTFRTLFFPRTDEEYNEAQSLNLPIYSTYMGDLAWDNYWYSRKWAHPEYKGLFVSNYSKYHMRHFSVIGNHDHDGAVYTSDSVDFMSAQAFRTNLGPNYYSYNIGKVHFITLDDIIYQNEDTGGSYSTGIVGSRNYTTGFSAEQINWAKKDLAMVDDNTIVVLSIHAPMYKIGSISQNTTDYGLTGQAEIEALLDRFKQVFIWSGHRHVNYNMNPTAHPNIIEHNINQMGGDLYGSSYYSGLYSPSPQGVGRPVSADGTPGSYQIFTFYGDSVTWRFKGLEKDNDGQFHVFDGNSIRNFWQTDATMTAICAANSDLNEYASLEDNAILINVFNYDPKWKIEVFEGSSTTSLKVSGYYCRSIYHILAYEYNYYKNKKTLPSITGYHLHTFKAIANDATTPITVKVTDRFGNIYQRTITRPQTVSLNGLAVGENTETVILTGIDKTFADNAARIDTYVSGNDIVINAEKAGVAQITSVDGMTRTVTLRMGENRIPAPQRGVNIITVDGKSKKLYVK